MTKQEIRTVIGQNIRNERIARRLTVDELSEMLDLTPGFVGLIERGQRGTASTVLYKLSEIFDMPIDAFFRINIISSTSDDKPAYNTVIQKEKIASFISRFNEKQLEFVIAVIREMSEVKEGSFKDAIEEE